METKKRVELKCTQMLKAFDADWGLKLMKQIVTRSSAGKTQVYGILKTKSEVNKSVGKL